MIYFLRRIFRLLLLIVALWALGLLYFISQIPSAPSSDDTPTDAIVVLTGGTLRLEYGLDLLAKGKAKKLFISGVGKGVTVNDILATADKSLFLPPTHLQKGAIVLGHEATDTRSNAKETAEWMRKEGFSSLRLVTANYHIPRSELELSMAMPFVRIIPDAVFPEHFKFGEWWKFRGTALLILSEYHKTIAVRLHHDFGITLRHSEGLL